jgi:hypothetical protein
LLIVYIPPLGDTIFLITRPRTAANHKKGEFFMKKTILTAFVALLVMLAVSCDNIPGQKPDTEDGFVTLSISTGGTAGGRSLSHALALGAANHIEVIFRKDTVPVSNTYKYYRAHGYLIEQLKVKIPTGTYQADDAILLIGLENGTDHTLLATGMLDASELTGAGGTLVVTSATDSITFDVKSLVADIHAGAVTPAFIVDPSSGTTPGTLSSQGYTAANIIALHNGSPWYQVPAATTGIKATLTIKGLDESGKYIVRNGGVLTGATANIIKFNGLTGMPTLTASNLEADGASIIPSTASAGDDFSVE